MRKGMCLLAMLLAAALLGGCAQEAVEIPELMEPVGVQSDMAAAYIGEIFEMTYYDASVVPYVEELYFEVDGQVEAVHVYPGKEVEAGDVLIELDQEAQQEKAEQLRSSIEYAERDNAYSDALAELDIEMLRTELKQLMAQGGTETQIALKQNEIAQKEAALRQTKALREPELEAQRKALEDAEALLDKNVIRAPFTGRIVYGKEITQGSWISAYDPLIFLADDTRLELRSEYVSSGLLDNASRVYARVLDQDYEIEVEPIDQKEYISTVLAGGTIYTDYLPVGPEDKLDRLEAGQYAAICVLTGYIPDALLVPSGAVLRDTDGKYVYVDENGSRVRRAVVTGMSTDGLVQIKEGLEEGEVVYVKD